MRRLFWRIFAAFWLAIICLTVAMAWITSSNFESEQIPGLQITRLQAVMDDQLSRIRRDAWHGNAQRIDHSLRVASSRGPINYYAIDEHDRDLLGRPLPAEVQTAVAALRVGDPVSSERLRAQIARTRKRDTSYVIVAVAEGNLFMRMLYRRPFTFWSHVLIAFVIGAAVSALLAWYVAAPLARIRRIARRFAEGDLDARVGELRFGRSREITALAQEFDRMAGRLKSLLEDNRRLVRDVSHELRSPLARMRVALELARGADADTIERCMDRIELESDRLEGMLAQAIELSRLETRVHNAPELLALDALVEDVIANADYEGAPRGRRVLLQHREPLRVFGSHDALYSAIENVVRNALIHSDEHGNVEVSLLRDSQNPARAEIRIRDHGPGVDTSELARIFEPFHRTDGARARRSGGGSGLGLAICRRAIENHGGSIEARNADGGGLEVSLYLPLQTTPLAAPNAALT